MLNAQRAGTRRLPGSIQALVLARMDRLAAADRKAIQAAAVLGQRFSMEALGALWRIPHISAPLSPSIFWCGRGMDYLFCHALIRDGAYESLLKSRRRELPYARAEWYSGHDAVVAAGHYDRAGDPRAARAHLVASEAEAARYHYSGALVLAERGLALATILEDRFALASMRAKILHDMGRAYESIEAWRAALDRRRERRTLPYADWCCSGHAHPGSDGGWVLQLWPKPSRLHRKLVSLLSFRACIICAAIIILGLGKQTSVCVSTRWR